MRVKNSSIQKMPIIPYGSLQKILKYGLQQIDLGTVKKILLLGMGGGSVIQTLRTDYNYQHHIHAVDIDPLIIKIAREEFDIHESEDLKITCEDARLFMQLNTAKYDLIIIDLFIDIKVPAPFLQTSFWQQVIKAQNAGGTVLCNAALQAGDKNKLGAIMQFLKAQSYRVDILEKANTNNTMFIARSAGLMQ